MKRTWFAAVMALSVILSLGACGGPKNKIGSTVKGTRFAVMDEAKSLKADAGAATLTLGVPEAVANNAWAQAGYDASHLAPNAALAAHVKPLWSVSIGEGSTSDFKVLARPVVLDGMVFAMDAEGNVGAYDAASGAKKWFLETAPKDSEDPAIGGGIAADGERVYATTGFGEVLAIQANSGKVIWRHALLNPIRAAPTVANGHVYVVSIDNQLSALNAETGEVDWQHRGIAEAATLMGASSPAVAGDSVVVAYASGEIYNLRAENGRSSWNYALTTPTQIGALPAIADIRGLPVIDHGKVFAVSHSGRVASVDQRTGDKNWEADIGGINTPVVTQDALYMLSNEGDLVALSIADGRIVWVQPMQRLSDPADKGSDPVSWTGPTLAGGRLWLTSSIGQVAGFAPANGQKTDEIDLESSIYIAPVVANGVMYVVTDEGELVALK